MHEGNWERRRVTRRDEAGAAGPVGREAGAAGPVGREAAARPEHARGALAALNREGAGAGTPQRAGSLGRGDCKGKKRGG